ncbi:MAG: RNA recognition motif domain-containing protein [Candidatus Sericytochromatia bacterium]
MNIYVGNLSYQADEQSIGDLFATYGEVTNVRIMMDRETGRPRGFGFVEMAVDAEAQKAIEALDGVDNLGRQLKINEAKPREERGGGNQRRGSFSRY